MAGNISILMTYGDVKGDATDAAHKNWVRLNSCLFDVIRNVTQESGNPKRNVGTPSISTLKLTKKMDSATPGVFLESLTGSGQNATIHFCQGADGSNLQVFMEYKLENALISSYSVDAEEGDNTVHEHFTISFTTIKTVYTPYDTAGRKGTPMASGYNITEAKRI